MTRTERPTVKKFCDQGALSSPREMRPDAHRTGHTGQPSLTEPVIGPLLTYPSGMLVVGPCDMDGGEHALLCGDGLTGVSRLVYAW